MAVRTSPAGGQALPGWVRARAGTDPGTVHLTVVDPAAVTADAVDQCCAQLAASGYHRAVTNALAEVDADALLAAGFRISERLDLLGRGLEDLPARPTGAPRVRRTRDHDAVVALDRSAFGDRGLDRAALRDALDATPAARLRVAGPTATPVGYVVTGLAGSRAYVQRLAVHPDARRQGVARALLVDGLRWARRRKARTAVVNTHAGNHAARALYESSGFVVLPRGLVVVERAL